MIAQVLRLRDDGSLASRWPFRPAANPLTVASFNGVAMSTL